MIKYVSGDIFTSVAQTLVNPVNCSGAMGAGLAKQFAYKYPYIVIPYANNCKAGMLGIGELLLFDDASLAYNGKWVLCFPTKYHWRDNSRLEYIESGLLEFVTKYQEMGITSIAFPMLGCGLGNLDWIDVKPLFEKYLSELPIDVYVYEEDAKEYGIDLQTSGSFVYSLRCDFPTTWTVGANATVTLDNINPVVIDWGDGIVEYGAVRTVRDNQ